MAITFAAGTNGSSKTAGTSVSTSAATIVKNDLLVIGFACDDTAGTYTPSDNSGNTYTLCESVISAGTTRTYLWYAFALSASSNMIGTVTHPSLTARAIFMGVFRGVGNYQGAGAGVTGTGTTVQYITNKPGIANGVLFVGAAGVEGPTADTFAGVASGSPSLTSVAPANGHGGTTGGSAATNQTVQLCYAIAAASEGNYYGQATLGTARASAGAGAMFTPLVVSNVTVSAVGAVATAEALSSGAVVKRADAVRSVGGIASGEAWGGNTYRATVMAQAGLVGYWRLGEASGTFAKDEVGANNGAYEVGPVMGVAGAIGDGDKAVTLDGNTLAQNVVIPHSASLNVGDVFTTEAWVNYSGSYGVAGAKGIISKGGGAYYMRTDDVGNLRLVASQVAEVVISASKVPVTGWHHIVCTKNGATVRQYIDGVNVTGTVTNATMATNSNPVRLGADIFGSGGSEFFHGTLDEVALYNVALSAADVLAHFRASPLPYRQVVMATSGLVGYWRLGESAGAAAVDETGSNPGSYVGSPTRGVAGATGDGNTAITPTPGNYVSVPDSASLDSGNSFSLEAWVLRNSASVYQGIMGKGRNTYALYVMPGGTLRCDKHIVARLVDGSVVLSLGVWHHVVLTKDGAVSARMYVDGVDVSTGYADQTMVDSAVSLYIGGTNDDGGAATNVGLSGVDEAALYNRPLTASEVWEHWRSGPASAGTGPVVTIRAPAQPVTAVGAVGTAAALGLSVVARGARPVASVGAVSVPGGPQRMFADWTPTGTSYDATTVGNRFTVNAAGQITHIRFWHVGGDGLTTHHLQIYDSGGTKVVALEDACGGGQPTGWRTTALVTPLSVAAGSTYTVAHYGAGWYYGWLAQAVGSLAPDLSIVNGYYLYGADGFPVTGNAGVRYTTDVVFQPVASAVGVPVVALTQKVLAVGKVASAEHFPVTYATTVLDTLNVVAYWRFGEAYGTTAIRPETRHISGQNVGLTHGTASPGWTPTPTALADGTACLYVGSADWVSFGNLSNGLNNASSNLSVEAWVQRTNAAAERVIIANGVGGFELSLDSTHHLQLVQSGLGLVTTSTGTVPLSGWHHVVATWAVTGQVVHCYIDGVDAGGIWLGNTISSNGGDPLDIGARWDGVGTSAYWGSFLDEIAVYDRALTQSEVSAHFAAQSLAGVGPRITVSQGVSAVGAVGTVAALGLPVVARGVRGVTAVGAITTAAALGQPSLSSARQVTLVGGITTAAAFGTAAVARGARPVTAVGAVAGASALGLPSVVRGGRTLTAVGGVASVYVSGVSVVTRGARGVTAVGGVGTAVLFGLPTVVRAGDLNQYVSGAGMVPSGVGFGSLSVGRGPITLQSSGILSAFTMGSAKVAVLAVSVSSVGGVASLVSFGAITVTGLSQYLGGVSVGTAFSVGNASLSMRLYGQAFEQRDYEGVGSLSVPSSIVETGVGTYPAYYQYIQQVQIYYPVEAGSGYLLFLYAQGGFSTPNFSVTDSTMVWTPAGAYPATSSRVMAVFRAVAPTTNPNSVLYVQDTTGYYYVDLHWLIVKLAGADVSGVNGEHLIARGPDFAEYTGNAIYSMDRGPLLKPTNFHMMFARTRYVMYDVMVDEHASAQQTSYVPSYSRAQWNLAQSFATSTQGSTGGGNPNGMIDVEISTLGSATPIWLSGVRVATAIAFGVGNVPQPPQRIDGSEGWIFSDMSEPVGTRGYVTASTISGAGLNLSSAVGAAGRVEFGKRMTFSPRVWSKGVIAVPKGGTLEEFDGIVMAVGSFSPIQNRARNLYSAVHARVRFAIALRAKRAIASITVVPVTVADVVVAALTRGGVVVEPLVAASIVVVRNEDELMTERDEFDIGDVARVTATVTSLGALKDPATVTFQFKTPDGLLTTTNAIRTGAGVYYGDIPCQQPGRHWWRISGSADASFGEEGAIRVRRSAVLDT